MTKKDMINTKRPVVEQGQPPVSIRGFTDTNKQRWIEVEYKGATALIEYNLFAGDRGGVQAALSQKDLVIVRRADKASLFGQVEELDDFPPRLIFARPGWCQHQYANASGRVFWHKDQKKGAVAFVPNPTKCAKKGAHTIWQEQVANPLVGHPIPSFFLMVALAAPMLELSGRTDNFGFELVGQGGKGKTTTQRLMASVVGPAMDKDRGYITTFYMTPAALEKSMRWHADMPFIIDEANLFGSGHGHRGDKRQMRDFGFQMSSGTTKGRFDTPGQEGYRFIFVTSANEPFNQLLGETHQDVANAATDRLMSITVPEGDAGVFGPLPSGFENYRQFILALETGMSQQYGTAMIKFLQKLVKSRHKDEDGLRARIRRRIDEFKRKVGVNDNNGSDVRVAEAFGLVYAAGSFARYHSVLPQDFNCLGSAHHCYANFRSTVSVRQSLPERLLAIANRPETMAIDRKNRPDLTDAQITEAGAFVRESKGGTLLLMTPAFGNMMLPDWNALKSAPDFVALNKAHDKGRGRGYHCRIRSNRKTDWFYCFRMPGGYVPRE